MVSCDFNDTCHFLNKKAIAMPLTTMNMVESFCRRNFTGCTIHRIAMTHGIDKVPRYVSPDDKYELSNRIIELARGK